MPALHSAADVGDEALLLSQFAPTVVSADRPSGAKLLATLGAEIVIMDDGFQNPSLTKDLTLIVIDAARGIGNGFVFPAGPLRAPLATQIRRADALVVIGEGSGGKGVRLAARAGRPTLHASSEPARRRGLKRRSYLAFAGIADPEKFYASLTEAGGVIGHSDGFSRPSPLQRSRMRSDPGGGETPRSRADHDGEGPRAAEPAGRSSRAAGGDHRDPSDPHPLRGAAAVDGIDHRRHRQAGQRLPTRGVTSRDGETVPA